jgi:hypothetical protein
MPYLKPRRTLSLETLEYRITPTVLGLTLPAPLAGLTSQVVGLVSPIVSASPPSQGQSGLGLGVNVGILSLQAGVGSGGSLLSLGGTVDAPLVSPLAVQTTVGSPQGLISAGVEPAGVLPPANVTTGTLPVSTPVLPPVSVPGVPASAIAPLPVTALQPATAGGAAATSAATGVVGDASSLGIGVTGPAAPTTPRSDSSATLHSPQFNDQTFTSFSALRAQPKADATPRAEEGDDLEDELFSMRDGQLLEDFGAAMGAQDAAPASDGMNEASQEESDGAVSPWLVGLFAGCVAGSAWLLTRRQEEGTTPEEPDPRLIPLE